jgi:hypothetical protein
MELRRDRKAAWDLPAMRGCFSWRAVILDIKEAGMADLMLLSVEVLRTGCSKLYNLLNLPFKYELFDE